MSAHKTAFYTAVLFILGILFAGIGFGFLFVLLLTISIAVIIARFLKINKRLLFLSVCFLVGFGYYHLHLFWNEEVVVLNSNIEFQGIIRDDPNSRIKSQSFNIDLIAPYQGIVRVYTSLYPEFQYGDLLRFKGTIIKSPSGKINMSNFPNIGLISSDNKSGIKLFLFQIKRGLIENIQGVLSLEKASLMSGLLLGDKAEFSDEFKEALNRTGTTHIVALSGYNIAILASMVSVLFAYFSKKIVAVYATVITIIAFVLMTGAEASVVRAAIMGLMVIGAEQYGRFYSVRNAIVFSAFIMVIFSPVVLFDIGFQLSFAALLGLIYLTPYVRKLIRSRSDGIMGWRKILTQTVGAQLGAAPIILYNFGFISPFSVITNVLILGFIPITMLLGFITAVSGFLSYGLSLVIGWVTGIFLSYEIFIINLFSFNWF